MCPLSITPGVSVLLWAITIYCALLRALLAPLMLQADLRESDRDNIDVIVRSLLQARSRGP